MAILFDIVGLTKSLGEEGERSFELRAPRVSIPQGAFVAITGKSGSGKSTLLDVVSLISEPGACERFAFMPKNDPIDLLDIWRRGGDEELANVRRRHMGYVLQTGALCSFLDVRGNIGLPLRMNGFHDQVDQRLSQALERLEMAGFADRDVRSLSGGERQRVAILRALIHRPAVVFADEPTAALDFDTAQTVLSTLKDLAQTSGATIIMVTHDTELIEPFADFRMTFARMPDAPAGPNTKRVFVASEAVPA